MLETGLKKVLLSEAKINAIVKRLGNEITAHYKNSSEELIVVGLLRGSFIFMADLVRQIKHPMITDFMTVSSYGDNTTSSGDVKIIMDLDETVLDNSKYQIGLVKKNESYNPESWSLWVNTNEAELVPGAKEFIDSVHKTNVRIIFLSNRMAKNELPLKTTLTPLRP